MTPLQKALVLLDMARDHMRDDHDLQEQSDARDDFGELLDDLDNVIGALEAYSSWPSYDR